MRVKVTVKTPKNQAQKSVDSQKSWLVGFKLKECIVEQKVVKHNEFYWILDVNPEQLDIVYKNAAQGEVKVRKFYRTLIKLISRANKLAGKFGKAQAWIKNWVIKKLKKMTKDDDSSFEQLQAMGEYEFIQMNDREDIEKLISGEMISVEVQ